MARQHFVAKLTVGKGPEPTEEIAALVGAGRRAVLGTRLSGAGWSGEPPPCHAVVFHVLPDGTIDGIVADILLRRDKMPADAPALYEPWKDEMKAWWTLTNIRRLRPGLALEHIPGRSEKGLSASKTFSGNASFAYWVFDANPRTALVGE